jgi:hypothetical protein
MKVTISLIHNFNETRNEVMNQTVTTLLSEVIDEVDFDIARVGWQPQRINLSLSLTLRRAQQNAITGFLFTKYCKKFSTLESIKSTIRGGTIFVYYLMRDFWLYFRGNKASGRHHQLTQKHLRAWNQLVDSESEFLMVLEDDAVLLESGEFRMKQLISSLSNSNSNQPLLVQISSGFSFEHLKVDHLLLNEFNSNYVKMTRPFINSTAGYIINRKLAENFLDSVSNNPIVLLNNADFLINRLLMMKYFELKNKNIICFHLSTPIVDNASLSGKYESSI